MQRVSPVIPDWATRYTYFSHSVRTIRSEISAGISARPHAARKARARAVSVPSISPRRMRPSSMWAMTPGASIVANTWATPPSTWPGPRMRASLSSLSTPFWMESTPVPGPTTGRIASAALSVSNDFTQKSTRSAAGSPSSRSTAATFTTDSPSMADLIRSPCSRIAARCAPRATNVTSSPARASFAPKYPPVPPDPITTIRMCSPLGTTAHHQWRRLK